MYIYTIYIFFFFILCYKSKLKSISPLRFHPSDISWWNEESLIISRVSGALSVLRMEDLSNLLGDAPEFLDGVPRISQSFEKGTGCHEYIADL